MGALTDKLDDLVNHWRNLYGAVLRAFLAEPLEVGLESLLDILGKRFAPTMRPLIDTLEATGEVPPELAPLLEEIKHPTGEIGALLSFTAARGGLGMVSGGFMATITASLDAALKAALQPSLLDVRSIIDAERRGAASPAWTNQEWLWTGFNTQRREILRATTKPLLDIETLRRLYYRMPQLRQMIDDILGYYGFNTADITALKLSWPFFPTPQDVVTWAAREVFEADAVAKYGLDAEFGNLDLTLFEKTGMSVEQAKNYWRAHWQHASWGQVQEMMFRGQLTEADAYDWFRLVEIPPYWRDKLIATAYHPLTRVDVRRMWRIGVIDTRAKLIRRYKDVGYNDANAGLMADFTIKYESEATRDLTRSDIEDGYRKGLLNPVEAHDALIESGYSEDETDFYLARQDYKTETARIERYASKYRKLYVKGLVDSTTVRTALGALGATPAQLDDYLDLWEIERGDTVVDEGVAQRDLTRTDILRGYREGLIERTEANSYLLALGYDADSAAYYLDLEDLKQEQAKRDLSLATYKKLYVENILTKLETTAALANLEFGVREIELLYTLWDIEKAGNRRLPTMADLRRFLRKGIIDEGGYAAELAKAGYGPEYIAWYVKDTRQ